MSIAFLLHVKLSWGTECNYLLANDVELGLLHRYQTRKNWQEVIIDALINVPVAPYLPNGQHLPPMATARVLGVEAVELADIDASVQRTRSQFIMAIVWQKQTAATNYNFLHHDYDKWTQRQIWGDVDFWCNHHHHSWITLVTKSRCFWQKLRLQRLAKKNKEKY